MYGSIFHRTGFMAIPRMFPARFALAGVVLMGSPFPSLGQSVLYVDVDATGPTEDGLTWCTGFRALQDALDFARSIPGSVTEIRMADGVYRPDVGGQYESGNREASFFLIPGLTISGGFYGCASAYPDDRDILGHPTRLSGDLLDNDSDQPESIDDNAYHVVRLMNTGGEAATLNGLTVENGNADQAPQINFLRAGGGIWNRGGSLILSHCLVSNNHGRFGAGIANSRQGQLLALDCVFEQNSALDNGGALVVTSGSAAVRDSQFVSNSAEFGGGTWGAGVSVERCRFEGNSAYRGGGMVAPTTVADSVFLANSAEVGAGIYFAGSFAGGAISNCLFEGNDADDGGAIGGSAIQLHVSNTRFKDNHARFDGGAIYLSGTEFAFQDCLFQSNRGRSGGAMAVYGLIRVRHSAFVRNDAREYGGAIYTFQLASLDIGTAVFSANSAGLAGGAITTWVANRSSLVNSTVVGNASAHEAGGIYVLVGQPFTIANSIIRGNTAQTQAGLFAQVYPFFGDVRADYSNIQDHRGELPGAGNFDADPMFADPLGPDGLPGTGDEDFRLLPGSPCIDAGDNSLVPDDLTTDFAGNPRFIDDPLAPDAGIGAAPIVDLGAFERRAMPLDILPRRCPNVVNPKSRAPVELAILGAPGFDVSLIDPDSLRLAVGNQPPVPSYPLASAITALDMTDVAGPFFGELCDCGRVSRDGFDDFIVTLPAQALPPLSGPASEDRREAVLLTVHGALTDGTTFEATDCLTLPGR